MTVRIVKSLTRVSIHCTCHENGEETMEDIEWPDETTVRRLQHMARRHAERGHAAIVWVEYQTGYGRPMR